MGGIRLYKLDHLQFSPPSAVTATEDGSTDDQDSRGPGFEGPSEILYNFNNMSISQHYNMPRWYILPIVQI